MATQTQAELATRVLRRLKVLVAGETANSDDDAVVDDAIETVYGELEENGLAYFPLSAIPDSIMPGLVRMVASEVAPEFDAETPITENWRGMGERMIRRVAAKQTDHQVIPQTYF